MKEELFKYDPTIWIVAWLYMWNRTHITVHLMRIFWLDFHLLQSALVHSSTCFFQPFTYPMLFRMSHIKSSIQACHLFKTVTRFRYNIIKCIAFETDHYIFWINIKNNLGSWNLVRNSNNSWMFFLLELVFMNRIQYTLFKNLHVLRYVRSTYEIIHWFLLIYITYLRIHMINTISFMKRTVCDCKASMVILCSIRGIKIIEIS